MNQRFWRGRRVFVTGHTGFKGSWLGLLLLELGAEVHGFALPPDTTPALYDEAGLALRMHSCLGDVRDAAALDAALRAARPEIVLHLAAQAIVSTSYREPLATLQTNVLGTANLLESLRQMDGVKAVVVVTSDKCYENHETGQAYMEHEPLGGKDPYSASKACTEIVTAAWRQSFFGKTGQPVLATARAGNVIGGGDWSQDRLIPDMVRAFRRGQPVIIRNPDAVRPWQHVLEPLAGYLALAERCAIDAAGGQAWNFGPDARDSRTVREIADTLVRLWGGNACWQPGANPVPEARLLRLDSTKSLRDLQWRPVTGFDTGLRMTAEWYRRHAEGENALALTQAQIRDYLKLAQPSET